MAKKKKRIKPSIDLPPLYEGKNIVLLTKPGSGLGYIEQRLLMEGASSVKKKLTMACDLLVYLDASAPEVAKAKKWNDAGKTEIELRQVTNYDQDLIPITLERILGLWLSGDAERAKGEEYLSRYLLRSLGDDFFVEDLDLRDMQLVRSEQTLRFRNVDFSGAKAGYFPANVFDACLFDGAEMEVAGDELIRNCDFRKAPKLRVVGTIRAEASQFDGMKLEDFPDEVKACSFRGCEFERQSWSGKASASDFREAQFPGLSGTEFSDCDFRKAMILGPVDESPFSVSKNAAEVLRRESHLLIDTSFHRCDMRGMALMGVRASNTTFTDCNMTGVDFTEGFIGHVTFKDVDLSGVSFRRAVFHQVTFENVTVSAKTDFSDAVWYGSVPNLPKAKGLKGAVGFACEAFAEWDQLVSNSEAIELFAEAWDGDTKIRLKFEVNTRRQVFSMGFTPSYHLPSSTAYSSDQLAFFASRHLGASLNLDSLKLSSKKAPLKGKALKELALRMLNQAFPETLDEDDTASQQAAMLALLDGTKKGVKAWNKALENAPALGIWQKVQLDETSLDGLVFVDFTKSSFRDASLRKAVAGSKERRYSPELPDNNFDGADLVGASFYHCSLENSSFRDADLSKVRFDYCGLGGVDFTGATFHDTTFVVGSFDEKTIWPKGQPIPSGMNWRGKGPDPSKLASVATNIATGGPVDAASFEARLREFAGEDQVERALEMLRKKSFQLFIEDDTDELYGVVRSPSTKSRLYACRIASDGSYACGTQKLRVCAAQRGSFCKHLMVLLLGLSRVKGIDLAKLDAWVQRSEIQTPSFNKERAAEIFLKYKGVEAGEVDWRPTETVPEDYYV